MQKVGRGKRLVCLLLTIAVCMMGCFVFPCTFADMHDHSAEESTILNAAQISHAEDATAEYTLQSATALALSMIMRSSVGHHGFNREAVRGNFYFILAMLIKMAFFSMLMVLEISMLCIFSHMRQILLFIHNNDGKKRTVSFFAN